MEKKEVIKFMQRIKSHYQEFVIDDFKIAEWYGKLKDYDAEDVNKKFDDHLSNEEYGRNIPKVAFLTKYLTKSEDKGKIIHYTVICQACEQPIPDTEYDRHYQRCCESNTIVRDLKKYFDLDVDKATLMQMSDKNFEKTYQRYLNKMLDMEVPKQRILRCIYPDAEIDINSMIKEMTENDIK